MPALFIFLLKVNIALIIFCLGYYLVLRKLTFYTLNRIYLVGAIIASSVYPLIDVNELLAKHREIATPVQVIAINWQVPQQIIEQPAYWQWLTMLFWVGVAVFAARLILQFLSLYKLYRKSSPATIQHHQVRVTQANISPFSFWKNIYINPNNIEAADLPSVLAHEQVHVKEWHTLDILLSEISVICYWFNPGIWLMKRAVRENIEFITDRKVLQTGADTKAYQYSLLHVSLAGTTSAGISNHFNFSTLKKRIKMMNTKKSSNLNLTRYAVLVPMVTVLLLVFSFSKAELIKHNREQLTELLIKTVNPEPGSPKQIEIAKPAKVKRKVKTDTTKNEASSVHYVKVKGVDLPIGVPYGIYAKSTEDNQDTIVKTITILKGDHPDSTKVLINGKPATQEDLATAATNLKEVRIMQETDRAGQVTGIKINSQKQTVGQVHFTYDLNSDTTYRPGKVNSDGNTTVSEFKANPKYSFRYDLNSDGNVNRSKSTTISNKLTIIDGKEATEKQMKKLPASAIEKVQIRDADKEMIQQYGDKAKDGVVFITTKKNQ